MREIIRLDSEEARISSMLHPFFIGTSWLFWVKIDTLYSGCYIALTGETPMSTFRAIALVVASCAVTLAVLAPSQSARAQQPAPSATDPRVFADRATEGA